MTTRELRQLLEHVDDTREIVLRGQAGEGGPRAVDELRAVWSAARAEANLAYEAWRARPARATYAVFRAAEDRCDAAQDALASAAGPSAPVSSVTEKVRRLNQNGGRAD
jgi:hypothetical protein